MGFAPVVAEWPGAGDGLPEGRPAAPSRRRSTRSRRGPARALRWPSTSIGTRSARTRRRPSRAVLDSLFLTTGQRVYEFEKAFEEYLGVPAVVCTAHAHGVAPPRDARGRHRSRRRGRHDADDVPLVGERDPLRGRHAGLRRRRPGDGEHRPGGGRGRDHAADEGDRRGRPLRPPRRHDGAPGDRRPARPRPRRGRGALRRGAARRRRARAARRLSAASASTRRRTSRAAKAARSRRATARRRTSSGSSARTGCRRTRPTATPGKYQHWDMERLGYKYNLSDVAASLLLPQLPKLAERLARREEICRRYEAAFRDDARGLVPDRARGRDLGAAPLHDLGRPREARRDPRRRSRRAGSASR